jgi:hypothetical protein
MYRILIVLLAVVIPHVLLAQELNCDVTVNIEQVPSASRDYLKNFEADIEQYLNNFRWTTEDLGGEKIHCSMNIFFLPGAGENRYTAQVFIGSRRPVYKGVQKTDKETIILRVLDEKWEFEYLPNKPLYHDDFQFDPMADFLDFYANLILGFDFESYTELSGTPYFQKALNICGQAAGSPYASEWQSASVNYSRFSLADELISPKYQSYRLAFYMYHFEGIDLLETESITGLTAMLSAVESIAEIRQKQNPRSILLKTFFDTKYQELAEQFLKYPDRAVYKRLTAADPNHQTTYEEYGIR